MKITASLAFVAIISALALQLGSGYSIGGIAREGPQSSVGDPCTAGAGCNEHTECNPYVGQGFCTCADGFHADETFSCVSGAEVVGSTCRDGVGCEHLPHSECRSVNHKGTCQCSAGFQGDVGSTCTEVPASKVGDYCTAGSGCNGNTECSPTDGAGFCTCTHGYHADDTFSCVSGTEVVGSACRNGVGCEYLLNSECSSVNDKGTCQCSAGFHGDDGSTCTEVTASKVGDECTAGYGCTGNTECSSTDGAGFCTCTDGNHADDTFSCVSGTEVVGSACRNGVGCEYLPNSECSSVNDKGTCQCSAGFHGDDGSTCTEVPASKVGDACTAGYGCTGNTECSSTDGAGFCTCTHGYHADDTFSCVSGDAIIGSACTHNLGCEKVPGLKCNGTDDQGKCTCNDGFHAGGEGRNCVQDVGSPCNPSVGCFDPAAECKMNQMGDYTCQCREGFEAVGNICKKKDNGLHIRVHVEEAKDIDIEIDKF